MQPRPGAPRRFRRSHGSRSSVRPDSRRAPRRASVNGSCRTQQITGAGPSILPSRTAPARSATAGLTVAIAAARRRVTLRGCERSARRRERRDQDRARRRPRRGAQRPAHAARLRGRLRGRGRGRRRRLGPALRARPSPGRAGARPEHARRTRASRRSPSCARSLPETADRRADDAGRPGVRARGDAGRGARLRAEGGRRRRARRGRARAPPTGRTYLNPQLGARLAAEPERDGPRSELSEREIEVLRLIALGHTNSEIARAALPQRADGRVAPRAHPAEARALDARRAGPVRARQQAARSLSDRSVSITDRSVGYLPMPARPLLRSLRFTARRGGR